MPLRPPAGIVSVRHTLNVITKCQTAPHTLRNRDMRKSLNSSRLAAAVATPSEDAPTTTQAKENPLHPQPQIRRTNNFMKYLEAEKAAFNQPNLGLSEAEEVSAQQALQFNSGVVDHRLIDGQAAIDQLFAGHISLGVVDGIDGNEPVCPVIPY